MQAAVALHFAHYNLVRLHKTLRVTPAMAAQRDGSGMVARGTGGEDLLTEGAHGLRNITVSTLEEAKKMVARWLSHHRVTVKKEHAPLEVCQSAGRFAPKAEGKIISVSIRIDYEDSY